MRNLWCNYRQRKPAGSTREKNIFTQFTSKLSPIITTRTCRLLAIIYLTNSYREDQNWGIYFLMSQDLPLSPGFFEGAKHTCNCRTFWTVTSEPYHNHIEPHSKLEIVCVTARVFFFREPVSFETQIFWKWGKID